MFKDNELSFSRERNVCASGAIISLLAIILGIILSLSLIIKVINVSNSASLQLSTQSVQTVHQVP